MTPEDGAEVAGGLPSPEDSVSWVCPIFWGGGSGRPKEKPLAVVWRSPPI